MRIRIDDHPLIVAKSITGARIEAGQSDFGSAVDSGTYP